jgi:hypothetical protein
MEVAVCMPTEQAGKSTDCDYIGVRRGTRMEAAIATIAPSSPTLIMMLRSNLSPVNAFMLLHAVNGTTSICSV